MHLNTPTTSELCGIPDGAVGIAATLRVMSSMVRAYKKNMTVREKALSLIRGCPQKAWSCEVKELHGFVRDIVRYVNDINGVETVQTPVKTLELCAGDCDDKSVLLAAMLESIGHPTRFIAIGFEPGIYSHVYVETLIGRHWVGLETTEPVEAGWEPDPQAVVERMVFHN